jgi:GGDEF domain-containing protein
MPVGGARRARELAKLLAAAVHTDVGTPAGPLSASVGIAILDASSTPDDLLSRADDAMYAEKRTPRPAVRHLKSVE